MAGVSYLQNAANTYDGNAISGSNGYSLSALTGVNLIFKKFGIMTNTYLPVSQEMYQGQTKLVSKTTVGVTFSI
jgi:hypothetical protein